MRVLVFGATGTIGRATVKALRERGHAVVCFGRPLRGALPPELDGAELRTGDVRTGASIVQFGFRGEVFDAVVSCLASRSGIPADAWAIDHAAHLEILAAAKAAGVRQMVLLSAICVQKPLLAFQQAKLAFETELQRSGLIWSIVRPTAFFKSLAGQVERVRAGKPFLVFGDGTLTACKPISDADLGAYLAECLTDETRFHRILPIGGPGPAITPREQGEALFKLLDTPPRFSAVPVKLLDVIIAVLQTLGRVIPPLAAKAELARIGRYYATESMLVLDPATGQYNADATPETGQITLEAYYAALIDGREVLERGEHAVF